MWKGGAPIEESSALTNSRGGACAWPGPLDPRLHAATYKSVLARLLFVHNTILVGQFFLSNPVEQVNKKTAASFLMVSA